MRLRAAALLLALGLAWSGAGRQAALAADGETPEVKLARDHFKSGEKAFNAGDFAHALAEFEAGYALVPRPGFLLNMAHSERRLGHSLKARSLYKRYLLADPESKQRDEVLGFIAQLDSIIADEERAAAGPPAVDAEPAARTPALATPAPATAQIKAAAIAAPATAAAPVAAAVHVTTAPRPAADQARATPIYRRGWFWAAAGVVVVGVAAAVILGMRGGPTFHDDGSLGRLGH